MRFKFAIIGAGNVGKALGTSFLRAGHKGTYIASTAASTELMLCSPLTTQRPASKQPSCCAR